MTLPELDDVHHHVVRSERIGDCERSAGEAYEPPARVGLYVLADRTVSVPSPAGSGMEAVTAGSAPASPEASGPFRSAPAKRSPKARI